MSFIGVITIPIGFYHYNFFTSTVSASSRLRVSWPEASITTLLTSLVTPLWKFMKDISALWRTFKPHPSTRISSLTRRNSFTYDSIFWFRSSIFLKFNVLHCWRSIQFNSIQLHFSRYNHDLHHITYCFNCWFFFSMNFNASDNVSSTWNPNPTSTNIRLASGLYLL